MPPVTRGFTRCIAILHSENLYTQTYLLLSFIAIGTIVAHKHSKLVNNNRSNIRMALPCLKEFIKSRGLRRFRPSALVIGKATSMKKEFFHMRLRRSCNQTTSYWSDTCGCRGERHAQVFLSSGDA